jgi:hypothetical protein
MQFRRRMLDFVVTICAAAFFALSYGYAVLCEKL